MPVTLGRLKELEHVLIEKFEQLFRNMLGMLPESEDRFQEF